jgi:hypothetical protein
MIEHTIALFREKRANGKSTKRFVLRHEASCHPT